MNTLESTLLGFFIGLIPSIIVFIISKEDCTHMWKVEATTTHSCAATGKKFGHTKHYQCTKCLKVKNIRIGM